MRILVKSLLASLLITQASYSAEKEMKTADVLKHDPFELAEKFGDVSSAGEKRAATIWATAKRIETEAKLAKVSSVQAVQRLAEWREVLGKWQDLCVETSFIESGGGSMFGYIMVLNDTDLEVFLAKHMMVLSAKPAENVKPAKLDLLKIPYAKIASGLKETDGDKWSKERAKELKEELKNLQYSVAYLIGTLPKGAGRKAALKYVTPVTSE